MMEYYSAIKNAAIWMDLEIVTLKSEKDKHMISLIRGI